MKYKDFSRIAKISLKSRKKTTRNTVAGISFGMILLMPLLFLVMGFYIDLNMKVDQDPSIRVFNMPITANKADEDYPQNLYVGYEKDLLKLDGVNNHMVLNSYEFQNCLDTYSSNEPSQSTMQVSIDGGSKFNLDKEITDADNSQNSSYRSPYYNVVINVLDLDNSQSIWLKSDGEYKMYAGSEFSQNSKGEIMVSSKFLEDYNLTSDQILGKPISISYMLPSSYSDITTDGTTSNVDYNKLSQMRGRTISVVTNYTVVGIFDHRIYNNQIRRDIIGDGYNSQVTKVDYFWLTEDSFETLMGESTKVVYKSIDSDNYSRICAYYPQMPTEMALSAKSENCAFFPLEFGVTCRGQENAYRQIIDHNTIIEFDSYRQANNASSVISDLLKQSSTSEEIYGVGSSYATTTFRDYNMFYKIFMIVCSVLGIFGGIIFFATLLNLYNTIHYSVQSKKNYLGMMRAIGLHNKDVVRLSFHEIFETFKRSYIWTAIFGGGICFGIWYLFKITMNSDAVSQMIAFKITLNPIFILVAYVALIVVDTIISIVFSRISAHSVATKPILEVITDEK